MSTGKKKNDWKQKNILWIQKIAIGNKNISFETIIRHWKHNQQIRNIWLENFDWKHMFLNMTPIQELCFRSTVSKLNFLFRISVWCFQYSYFVFNRFWCFQLTWFPIYVSKWQIASTHFGHMLMTSFGDKLRRHDASPFKMMTKKLLLVNLKNAENKVLLRRWLNLT